MLDLQITRDGSSSNVLTIDVHIPMQAGDVIGIYFPRKNSIPYLINICDGTDDDALRYKVDPVSVLVGSKHLFKLGPPIMEPCRGYSFNIEVG